MAYIDTSVLVAYYCPEPLSQSIQKILEKVKETAAYGYLVKPFNEKELVTKMFFLSRIHFLPTSNIHYILLPSQSSGYKCIFS